MDFLFKYEKATNLTGYYLPQGNYFLRGKRFNFFIYLILQNYQFR